MIIIIAIITLCGFYTVRFLHVSFDDDFAGAFKSVPSQGLSDCIQKSTVGVSVSEDAIESCVDRNTPSHPTTDLMRAEFDELKWLLTLIVGIAALFSIRQQQPLGLAHHRFESTPN
jgi:hypothetical protein